MSDFFFLIFLRIDAINLGIVFNCLINIGYVFEKNYIFLFVFIFKDATEF